MKIRYSLGLAALLVMTTIQALAAPSSRVAWTPDVRRLVAGGDAVKGKELAQQCAGCHGPEGLSPTPAYPHLAGQIAAYTFKQLHDYKDSSRQNPVMGALAKALSDQDMADLGAFYAGLPPPQPKVGTGGVPATPTLVSEGDGSRQIPGCAYCHGGRGQGNVIDMPALAGQGDAYLKQTLSAFKSGQRGNDVYARMRLIAQQLTDRDIDELARYYSGLVP
jgi:cytochrome c553